MRIVRLDRTEIEVFSIKGQTFRFIRTEDVTGHVQITADVWSGWKWMSRHSWEGRRSERVSGNHHPG